MSLPHPVQTVPADESPFLEGNPRKHIDVMRLHHQLTYCGDVVDSWHSAALTLMTTHATYSEHLKIRVDSFA